MRGAIGARVRRAFPDLDAAAGRNFRLDVLAGVMSGLFMACVLNFVGVVARRLDATPFMLAVILAAPFLGSLLTIFSGYWEPRRQLVLYVGMLLAVGRGFPVLVGAVDSALAFTLVVTGMYVFSTLPSPQMVDLLRRIYPDKYRGRMIGLVRMAMTGTATVVSPVAGWLLDVVGPRVLFPLGAVFGMGSAIAYSRLQVSADEEPVPRFGLRGTVDLLRIDPRFRQFVLGIGLWGLGYLIGGPLYPIILVDRLQASYAEVGVLTFITSLAWLLSYLYWGARVDRRGPFVVLVFCMLVTTVVPIVYLLSPSVWVVGIASLAIGLANGGLDLASINALIRLAPAKQVSQYSALYSAAGGIRGIVAPFLGSAIATVPLVGLTVALVLASILTVAGAAIVWRVQRADAGARVTLRTKPL